MKRLIIGICVAFVLAGCGATGGKKAGVEQKDVFDKSAATAADEKARAEAAKADAERRAKEAAAKAAGDQAVVRLRPDGRVAGGALTDPASALKDPASPLSKRSIYYDFDMYNVRDEFAPIVEAHAKLVDCATGTLLWDGKVSLNQGNGRSDPIAALVGAVVDQVVNKLSDQAHTVAASASWMLLTNPNGGLLKGPRHPEHGK